ncbi:MAG: hypothetical protein ACK5X7_07040 [Pseudanabaena sp.]
MIAVYTPAPIPKGAKILALKNPLVPPTILAPARGTFGDRTPSLLKLYLVKRVFSSHHLSVICADKKQDTLTVQWGENANIIYRCTLSQVTQIQVHKQELKDSDGDSYSMYSVFLDLNSEAVNFPMYNEHLSSFVLQPMQFLGEFLDVPVKEIEVI